MAVFWCAGMYASGSTWAYNAMRAIAACAGTQPVRAGFVNTLEDLAPLADEAAIHVIKTHDLAPEPAALLRARAAAIVVTLRDPRDAVTSLMRYQRYPFALALTTVANSACFAAGTSADQRSLTLRYETGFPDDPATLDRLAAAMGMSLADEDRARIFAQSRRGAVEALIARLPSMPQAQRHPPSGDIYDPETQWHAHHAGRTGEIGRWQRMLRTRQIRAIEAELADFMSDFAYPASP